jgi:flagellar biosynthesis/type III secretory pathway M-ring protein FliF/YscJ
MRPSPIPERVETMSLSAEPADHLDESVGGEPDGRVESKIPRPHARRFDDAGSPLREELAELVATDPDAAASVLRNWIGPIE